MKLPELVLYAAIAATTAGMMLVVAGVMATGLFLPGVVVIGLGMIGVAVAAALALVAGRQPPVRD